MTKKDDQSMRYREFRAPELPEEEQAVAKGGVACPFPWRLHECLSAVEKEGLEHIISWKPHGRAFGVHNPEEFVKEIMPRFFGQTKFPSFQRQLNLYGFSRFIHGTDKGAYYHSSFVRGKRSLARDMIRRKIKGTKCRTSIKECDEPNFYLPQWIYQQEEESSVPDSPQEENPKRTRSPVAGGAPLGAPPKTLKFVKTLPLNDVPPPSGNPRPGMILDSSIRPMSLNRAMMYRIEAPKLNLADEKILFGGFSLEDLKSCTRNDLIDSFLVDEIDSIPAIENLAASSEDLFEPVPLREVGSSNNADSGISPGFKLVDPVHNIYLL